MSMTSAIAPAVQTIVLTVLTSFPAELSDLNPIENSPSGPKENSIPSAMEIAHEAGASVLVSSLLSGSSGVVPAFEDSVWSKGVGVTEVVVSELVVASEVVAEGSVSEGVVSVGSVSDEAVV